MQLLHNTRQYAATVKYDSSSVVAFLTAAAVVEARDVSTVFRPLHVAVTFPSGTEIRPRLRICRHEYVLVVHSAALAGCAVARQAQGQAASDNKCQLYMH